MTPRRVAVVGAGPSGIYAAQALAARDPEIEVDVIDRLPTPYGLLRYGVAPDHTSIKAIAIALAKVFESPRISFRGVVDFGADVTRDDLRSAYDAVVYAVGASEDTHLGIPGEQLAGSRSAREFVAWYCGHPDALAQTISGVTTAVTVGVGNVAIDVARVLVKRVDDLATTDMPLPVLDELARSDIRDVWVVGRRGPQHASFTTLELRELLHLPGVQPVVEAGALDGIDEAGLDRRTLANLAALRDAAQRVVPDAVRRIHMLFWHRPVELLGRDHVSGLVLERTMPDPVTGVVVGTGEVTTIPCELVLRSIGYRGKPVPGLPFDERRGVVPSVAGRVIGLDGSVLPREYVVGWIKRGPIGVIGTNKADAVETVATLLADLAESDGRPVGSVEAMWASRGLSPTTYEDWRRIEAAELAKGAAHGVAQTKIEAWRELLDLARLGQPGGPQIPVRSALILPVAKQTAPIVPTPVLEGLTEVATMRPGGDYDGVRLSGAQRDVVAPDVRLLECEVTDAVVETVDLRSSRLIDSRLARSRVTTLNLAGASVRDSVVDDCRIGALDLSRANVQRLLITGCKIDWLNLRFATVTDLTLRNCRVTTLDLAGATASWVEVTGSIDAVHLGENTLREVDLKPGRALPSRRARVLRGVTLSLDQSRDLAPALIAELGGRVRG